MAKGPYIVYARARDIHGAERISAPCYFRVGSAPFTRIAIIQPAPDSSKVKNTPLRIGASLADTIPGTVIVMVTFMLSKREGIP